MQPVHFRPHGFQLCKSRKPRWEIEIGGREKKKNQFDALGKEPGLDKTNSTQVKNAPAGTRPKINRLTPKKRIPPRPFPFP